MNSRTRFPLLAKIYFFIGDISYCAGIVDRGLFVGRAEDPDHVRENNIPLDVDYYIKKQILPPVERILGVFGVDMASLDYDSKQKGL